MAVVLKLFTVATPLQKYAELKGVGRKILSGATEIDRKKSKKKSEK